MCRLDATFVEASHHGAGAERAEIPSAGQEGSRMSRFTSPPRLCAMMLCAALVAMACSEVPTDPVPALDLLVTAADETASGPSVNGHMNATLEGGLQTLSFHARELDGGTVSGVFQLKWRVQDITLHGYLDCLNVVGNQAVVGGFITRVDEDSPIFDIEVGDPVLWAMEDNGEGSGVPADAWTDVLGLPWPCDFGAPALYLAYFGTIPVEAGNVQVKP